MQRRFVDKVVVITGASSGIGKATAIEFARQGATLALTARRETALEQTADECRRAGSQAMVIPADVTDEEAVKTVARRTIEQYGRLDVWVNNAGVSMFARVEEAPLDVYRRVLETNFFGCLHGARAALPYFREQGSGILINISSILGKIGAPFLSAYAASKFAITGLGESLRMELQDAPDIHVCTVLPASFDTPLFQNAANYTGRAAKPMNPVYDAFMVASAVLRAVEHPRREIAVGNAGRMIWLGRTLLPGLAEWMYGAQVAKDHFQNRPSEPYQGNLFQPGELQGVGGGWRQNGKAKGQTMGLGLGIGTLLAGTLLSLFFKRRAPLASAIMAKTAYKVARRLPQLAGRR